MCEAPAMTASRAPGIERDQFFGQSGRRDRILVADDHQRRDEDRGGPLALVGKPDRFGANPVSGGIDPAHGVDDVRANSRIGGGEQGAHAGFGETAHVMARGDRAVVDRLALGMHGKAVGDD